MLFYVPPSQSIGERCPVFNQSLFPLLHSPAQVSPSPHLAQNFITPLLARFGLVCFFSPQAVGMREPMNQPYYGFMCIPCFPNGHPKNTLSICCYSALLPPDLCQLPMPCRLVPDPAPIFPRNGKYLKKKKKEKQQKGSPPPTQPRTHSSSC